MSGENWNEVMYSAVDAWNASPWEQTLSIIFFVFNILAGHFVLLNIFLAIAVNTLMETFAKADLRDDHNLRWMPIHEMHEQKQTADENVVKYTEKINVA